MKSIYFNGENADLKALSLTALNNRTGAMETAIAIPGRKYLKLTIGNQLELASNSTEEVSEATSQFAMRHGRKRDYILFRNGRAVGYATLHRKALDYKVDALVTYAETVTVKAKGPREAAELAKNKITEVLAEANVPLAGITIEEAYLAE